MKLTGIRLPGYRIDRNGRLVRDVKRLNVSAQIRQRASKRVRVSSHPVGSRPGRRELTWGAEFLICSTDR
jgi:hypothetical protein